MIKHLYSGPLNFPGSLNRTDLDTCFTFQTQRGVDKRAVFNKADCCARAEVNASAAADTCFTCYSYHCIPPWWNGKPIFLWLLIRNSILVISSIPCHSTWRI